MFIALPNQQFAGKPYKILHNSMNNAIIQAANEANEFSYIIDSNIKRIRLYISFIRKYNEEINSIPESMHEFVNASEGTDFVKQIHLIETFKGAGFLSAVSLMGETGDFSAFSKPRQLSACFGLDPAVKQSGNPITQSNSSIFSNTPQVFGENSKKIQRNLFK